MLCVHLPLKFVDVLFVCLMQRSDILDWPREFPKEIPHQRNGCDCGVFTMLFANYAVSLGEKLCGF